MDGCLGFEVFRVFGELIVQGLSPFRPLKFKHACEAEASWFIVLSILGLQAVGVS